MLNMGLIGHGRVATRHADALQLLEGAQLWTVAGLDAERVVQFAEQYHANSSFVDIATMLSDPLLDAVIITTPDKHHAAAALAALANHKSVLIEKPICTDVKEGEAILKISHGSLQTAAVAYHLRWHDGLRKLAEQCHLQKLGELRQLKLSWGVSFFRQHKWRTDPSQSRWLCLTVLGTHLIDIARWFLVPLCGEIVKVESNVTNQFQSDFDEQFEAHFTFESGATCQINCSLILDAPFNLELIGTKATAIGSNLTGDSRQIFVNTKPLLFEKNNPYLAQLENFIRVVQQNTTPEVGVEEAVKNIKLLEQIWPGN